MRIVAIVEGHADVHAVPVLVRRLAESLRPTLRVDIPPPLRLAKSNAVRKPGELERSVDLAARKAGHDGAVLILMDSADDCPADLAPELLRRAQAARSDAIIDVVLVKREYEAWFLAAAASLRGKRGLRNDLEPPADPEATRGAKEWLGRNMQAGRRYTGTLDQPALSGLIDLEAARRAPSFEKLRRAVEFLVARVEERTGRQ
jgi:hypothetical protein